MKEGSCRWDVSTKEQGERSVCFPWLQIPLDGRKQSHILGIIHGICGGGCPCWPCPPICAWPLGDAEPWVHPAQGQQ